MKARFPLFSIISNGVGQKDSSKGKVLSLHVADPGSIPKFCIITWALWRMIPVWQSQEYPLGIIDCHPEPKKFPKSGS